ncbi:MAG: DUF2341 domain-containing protein [Lentisphaerae bacterium]|nr:DUF2341 domain-containing protein [Lentisphaerota bacterium]
MPITFSGYTPPDGNAETLIDFPVLVVLKETEEGAGFSYDDFLSPPYNDLRFTADDKKTLLDFEVDLWNPDGDSFVWVRVPELTAETSIYACWKSGGAELPVCTSDGSVWEENFKGVWHMNDGLDPLTVQESTANDITGIKLAMGLPAQVTGIIGNAQLFQSSSIDITGLKNLNKTHTISMWINGASAANGLYVFDTEKGRLLCGWGSDNKGKVGVYDGTWHDFGATPSLNTWHHLVYLCDLTSTTLYLDGEQYGSTLTYNSKTIDGACCIGARYSLKTYFFSGIIDEYSVSSTIRSPDWIWACWKNQGDNENFSVHGAPFLHSLPYISNGDVTEVTANTAKLNGSLSNPGNSDATVTVYWGSTDGGTDPEIWDNFHTWDPTAEPIDFSHQLTGLTQNSIYYYRFKAENTEGTVFAHSTDIFTTGDVWLEKISDIDIINSELGKLLFHRSSSIAQEPLKLFYDLSGTATPDLEYIAISGEITLPAGETTVELQIASKLAHPLGALRTITLSIKPVNARPTAPSSVTINMIPEQLSTWDKKISITFNGFTPPDGEGSVLEDFPALVVFSETTLGAGFRYNDFKSPPWHDLRFTEEDQVIPLDYEVELWDITGSSFVWVRIPELTADTTIYAFWGQSNVHAPVTTTNGAVWGSSYRAVWHMNDGTSTANILDSSTNRVHGTKKSANSPIETEGVIGMAQTFENNFIDITGLVDLDVIHTLSMWLKSSSRADRLYPFDVELGRFAFGWGSDNAGKIGLYVDRQYLFGDTPTVDTWHHLTLLAGNSTASLLVMWLLNRPKSVYGA